MKISDDPIRGEVRLAGHRRVSHGLFVRIRPGLSENEELLRDLRAYLLVLPPSAVFTHLTAAWLLGWQLPKLPEQVPVFVAIDDGDPRPRRHGLICSRLRRERRPRRVWGLPVDAPEEILLRAARDLGLVDLIVLIDSARRSGQLDTERMQALLRSRRPGVRMLREAWRRSTGRAESGPETLLQQFHVEMDVPFTPQAPLVDRSGKPIGRRADLLIDGTSTVHEYDGAHHRDQRSHWADLRRDRALADAGYTRRGYVLDDLVNHPAALMQELDRALRRQPDLRRLRRWHRLVDNSLYSEAGRERMMNRWRRLGGIVDWARTV
jgi:very-short-patch-repair endonuclease